MAVKEGFDYTSHCFRRVVRNYTARTASQLCFCYCLWWPHLHLWLLTVSGEWSEITQLVQPASSVSATAFGDRIFIYDCSLFQESGQKLHSWYSQPALFLLLPLVTASSSMEERRMTAPTRVWCSAMTQCYALSVSLPLCLSTASCRALSCAIMTPTWFCLMARCVRIWGIVYWCWSFHFQNEVWASQFERERIKFFRIW